MKDVPPPLLSFMLYHRSMRAGARRLADALAADPDADRLAALARWYDHYRSALLIHADGEDDVLWPALLAERPDLAGAVEAMEAEHAELAGVLTDLAKALSDPAHLGDARRLAGQLVDLVGRHLDGEEGDPLDAVIASFPVERLAEIMRAVQQNAGPGGPAVAVPFLLCDATDEERATVLGAVPPPVREGYESAWRPAYEELEAPLRA